MVTIGKIAAVIQCRMTSTRLTAKVMLDLGGKTLLERVLLRSGKSNLIDETWVATSMDRADDIIENQAKNAGYKVFRGPRDDVLKRYCGCIEESNAKIAVRITADNPFTEVKFIDLGIAYILFSGCDYVGFNNIPYGSGVEAFASEAIYKANRLAKTDEDREHVTLYILNNRNDFNVQIIEPPWTAFRRPDIRATIDTIDDYIRVREFYNQCEQNDSLLDYIRFIDSTEKWK